MRPAFYTAPPQPEVQIPWDDVAPVRGMDGTVPIHDMPPGTAVFLYNMIPASYLDARSLASSTAFTECGEPSTGTSIF